jgi:hypothetical protein
MHGAFPLLFLSPCWFPFVSPCSPFNPLLLTWNPPSCDRIHLPRSQVACKLTSPVPTLSPNPPPSKFPEPQLPSASLRRPQEQSGIFCPEQFWFCKKHLHSESINIIHYKIRAWFRWGFWRPIATKVASQDRQNQFFRIWVVVGETYIKYRNIELYIYWDINILTVQVLNNSNIELHSYKVVEIFNHRSIPP